MAAPVSAVLCRKRRSVRRPHRRVVSQALFRRQTKRISPRFGRLRARQVGPGATSQWRPATPYKTLSLCSPVRNAMILMSAHLLTPVRYPARRRGSVLVPARASAHLRVSRGWSGAAAAPREGHGEVSRVQRGRHHPSSIDGRVRTLAARPRARGRSPTRTQWGAHRLLGLRAAPCPAASTPPDAGRRPTITCGRSACVRATQGVAARRCGDGRAFCLCMARARSAATAFPPLARRVSRGTARGLGRPGRRPAGACPRRSSRAVA